MQSFTVLNDTRTHSRRAFLRQLGLGTLALAAANRVSGQQAASTEAPNILLIIGDDQGYADMGCTGHAPDVQTPNLDALAARGIRFTQSYASSPICNASRAGLITGCYQQRFGTFWYGGRGIHNPQFTTLPETLNSRDYTCGYVGKFHYGVKHTPDHRNFPLNHGFDSFYGFSGGRKHYMVHNEKAEAKFMRAKRRNKRKGQSLQQGPMWHNREQQDVEGYSTELFGEQARQFLKQNRDKPFFLQLAFNAVHNFTHQLPEEYLDAHKLKGYRDWDPNTEEYYDWYQEGRRPNNPEGRAHYLGQLHYLDREIGRVLDTLRELKLDRNTVVVYIGDNGGSTPIYADNTPLRGSKYTLYEGGIRVPMIVSWPQQLPEGKVLDNVVSCMDLYPTLCAVAGAKAPAHLDGMNLTPLLTGQDPTLHHDTLIWDTGHETAVRQGKWKRRTAKDDHSAKHEMVELELGEFLYDLEADPQEQVNLAEQHPDVMNRLKQVHEDWRKSLKKL